MDDWLDPNVLDAVGGDLAATYRLFSYYRAFIPTRTACTNCGGVDADGEPYDITCQYCDGGYVITWVVQEVRGRIADVALVTQIFVSVTPGITVGDKVLVLPEHDAAVLQEVLDNNEAYLEVEGSNWRPLSVQPSLISEQQEWVAHLVKHSPEVLYG